METYEKMRDEYSRRRLLLGIDRLDYSKGIPHRVRAFRELLDRYPENRGGATMIMIASPSRDDVHAYADLRQELEGPVRLDQRRLWRAGLDAVRYIHRMVAHKRDAGPVPRRRRGAGHPLRDGMNLVAKGIRGGAGPGRPRRAGAVTLCRCGGTAERSAAGEPLRPPGMADSIQQALQMPAGRAAGAPPEAHGAHQEHDVHWWRKAFLDALQTGGD